MATPQIILTNDDGIESPGLWAIAAQLVHLGELWVVAPDKQCSGAGRIFFAKSDGIIEKRASKIVGHDVHAYAVGGSPAQSVFHAIEEILPVKPDIVVSGINYGDNLGNVVTTSGTVGATIEAASYDVKGLAISLELDSNRVYEEYSLDVDFSVAASFGRMFSEKILENGLPDGVDFIKVDVPRDATLETPWRMTRVSRISGWEKKAKRAAFHLPAPVVWTSGFVSNLVEPDSDIHAVCRERVVAVSPMTMDMTAKNELLSVRKFLD